MENFKEMKVTYVNPNGLKVLNIKNYSSKEIEIATTVLKRFGFQCPIVTDNNENVVFGELLLRAAQKLGVKTVPTVEINNLSKKEIKAFSVAINKISEMGDFDLSTLKTEIQDLLSDMEIKISPEELGFSSIELDSLLFDCSLDNVQSFEPEQEEILPDEIISIVKTGDLIRLGNHMLLCGSALKTESFVNLLGSDKAKIVITDPPYNVKISDNVTKQKHHKEFVNASGEMSEDELENFLTESFNNLKVFSVDNSIHYIFMDWRHIGEIQSAGKKVYPKHLNLCIWNKLTGGMGSFYRSQHELCFVYQNGTGRHINNIELGKNGRNRTNVWDYKGMNVSTRQAKTLRKLHPTVKPTAMLMDIMLDSSEYDDIVLDCFGGSGSTLIAAEQCGRQARLIEISPHYCDVIISRWEKLTGKKHEIISNGEVING